MILKISQSFRDRLAAQVEFIARDKPLAARKFKSEILKGIKGIPEMPFKHRKSIFFDRDDIRDLVFKGYVIVYKVDRQSQTIEVFGFTKYEENPFK